jgi:hypothetical protein
MQPHDLGAKGGREELGKLTVSLVAPERLRQALLGVFI